MTTLETENLAFLTMSDIRPSDSRPINYAECAFENEHDND